MLEEIVSWNLFKWFLDILHITLLSLHNTWRNNSGLIFWFPMSLNHLRQNLSSFWTGKLLMYVYSKDYFRQCFFDNFLAITSKYSQNSELEEDFSISEWHWKNSQLGHVCYDFCIKFSKFWVSWEKSAELASKFAWVRPKNWSELGAQNRKKNTAHTYLCST